MSDDVENVDKRNAALAAFEANAGSALLKWDQPGEYTIDITDLTESPNGKGLFGTGKVWEKLVDEDGAIVTSYRGVMRFSCPGSMKTQFMKLGISAGNFVYVKYLGEKPSLKYQGKQSKSFVLRLLE